MRRARFVRAMGCLCLFQAGYGPIREAARVWDGTRGIAWSALQGEFSKQEGDVTEQRLFPKPLSEREITPFASARQAWFWFVRCQTARIEGARVVADAGEVVRPCDPDDVYNAVMRLKQAGTLTDRHLQVLEYFGLVEREPDPRDPREKGKDGLWRHAMAALENVLISRGIVTRRRDEDFHHDEVMVELGGDLSPCGI